MARTSRWSLSGRLGPLALFLHTAGTRVLGMASSSVLVVLLARGLDPDQYGVYALFTSTYVFGNLLLGFSLSSNLTRRVPGADAAAAARLLGTFVAAEMGLGAVVVAGLWLSGLDRRLASLLGIGAYAEQFRLILVMIWIDLGAGGCLNHLMARKRFGLANVLTLLRASLLGPLLAIAHLAGVAPSITVISWTWLLISVVSLGFGAVASGLPRSLATGIDRNLLRGAVPFGLMMASQSFAFYFLKLADRYVLARYASLHDTGIYSFAYTLSNIAYSLTALVIVGLYHPHVVEAHNRSDLVRRDALLGQLARISLAAVAMAALVAGLCSRWLVSFARPNYLDSARVLPWLLVTLVPVVAAYPASVILMVEGKLWVSVMAGAAAIAVAVPIDLWLVPRISYYGALVGSLVGFSLIAVVQHAAARSWRFLSPRQFLNLRQDVAQIVAGVRRSGSQG